MRRFYYVTLARVPGRKAHCSQIAQMCQAFLNAGVPLRLIAPARAEFGDYRGATIRGWYGLSRDVPAEKLPCIDVLSRMPPGLPAPVYHLGWRLLQRTYLRSLSRFLQTRAEDSVLYSRDLPLLRHLLDRFRPARAVAELHILEDGTDEAAKARETTVLKRCTGVVVVTGCMKEILVRRGIPAEKILVEPNAVNPRTFPGTADRAQARARLGLPPHGRIVLYIGNFRTLGLEKGLRTIVEAMPHVLRRHRDVTFYFVGGPMAEAEPYRSALARSGIGPAHYRFLDRRPYSEIHWWLAAADVLTMPLSRHPRFDRITSPLKVFEYMTAGRPIVVSDVLGLRGIVVHERNALVVPPDEPRPFADAVSRLLEDSRLAAALGAGAKTDVRGRTWDARAARIKTWMESLSR